MEREHEQHSQEATDAGSIEPSEVKESSPERLRFEKLPAAEQEKLLVVALEQMRQALGPVKDYVVFASTAMYLNGELLLDRGEEVGRELMTSPGDFDVVVFSAASLQQIRERLGLMANVEFDNDGKFISMIGEGAKKLGGRLVLELQRGQEQYEVEYDFEFFYQTFVVPRELAQGRTINYRGLQALNLEALHRQYEKNLNFESGVNDSVEQIISFLESHHPEAERLQQELQHGELSPTSLRLLDRFQVSAEELQEALATQVKITALTKEQAVLSQKIADLERLQVSYEDLDFEDQAQAQGHAIKQLTHRRQQDWQKLQELISQRATILAGAKTKIRKRQLNILQLTKIRGRQ